MNNNSLKLKFLLLLIISALCIICISCKKDDSNTETKPQKINQINYPNTLDNKVVFFGYSYGKSKSQPLIKTYFQKNHYRTELLLAQSSPKTTSEITSDITSGIATGFFHYELVNPKTGKAKLTLYDNTNTDHPNQNQISKIITIKFKSANTAAFTEKDPETGEISGGILTFSSNPGISN